jgi:cell division protein FtsZ
MGILTIGVVTRPFTFEGKRRATQAEKGIQQLREKVDTLIVIPNDRLRNVTTTETTIMDAFKIADDVLLSAVRGVTDLITVPGLINTDFADVNAIMRNAGTAIMGVGMSTGEGRAINAARAAITSPLLEASIEGARGILMNIVGGPGVTLSEVTDAASIIHEVAHPDANIIFGSVIDESVGEAVRVTVIAAGFDHPTTQKAPVAQAPVAPPVASLIEGPRSEAFSSSSDDDFLGLGADDDLPDFLRP